MDHEALMSRLRAACQNAPVEWTRDDDAPVLARKLVRVGHWESFSEKYDMHFDPETGEFIDVNELAHAMWIIQTHGSTEDREWLSELMGSTESEEA